MDIKKSSNEKIKNERTINVENIKKLIFYFVIIIVVLLIFISFFSSDKDKNEVIKTPTTTIKEETFIDNNENKQSDYDNVNRVKENKKNIPEIEEEINENNYIQQPEEVDPIEELKKQQELLKAQRYYQSKESNFKTNSIKMSSAERLKSTAEYTGTNSLDTLNTYNFNPYNELTNILDNKNPNMQKEKKEWIKQAAVENFVRKAYLTPAISRYEVKAGTFIPIILTFELVSDIPGKVTAMVRENIYDSVSGNYLLIPMGSKLFGSYNSELSWGQERVQVIFDRMTLPNGKSITLGNMLGASQLGQSGLTGKIDTQLSKVVGSIIMAAAVGGANGVLTNDKDDKNKNKNKALQGAGEEAGTQTVSVINNYANKILNVQPRITVPLGQRGTLVVTKDLILEAYDKNVEYLNKFE